VDYPLFDAADVESGVVTLIGSRAALLSMLYVAQQLENPVYWDNLPDEAAAAAAAVGAVEVDFSSQGGGVFTESYDSGWLEYARYYSIYQDWQTVNHGLSDVPALVSVQIANDDPDVNPGALILDLMGGQTDGSYGPAVVLTDTTIQVGRIPYWLRWTRSNNYIDVSSTPYIRIRAWL